MTYTILAISRREAKLGIAAATAVPCVGAVVPYITAGLGAIASQGFSESFYGELGLKYLQLGLSPRIALNRLLQRDGESELRQVALIDITGRVAFHNGEALPDVTSVTRMNSGIVIGNLLASQEVTEVAAKTFESSKQEMLEERLLSALQAGEHAGGDARGTRSCTLRIESISGQVGVRLDLRVDYSKCPLDELRDVLLAWRASR